MGKSYERKPVKAGTWYKGDRAGLSKQLEDWRISALEETPAPSAGKRVAAAICPHAGYAFRSVQTNVGMIYNSFFFLKKKNK